MLSGLIRLTIGPKDFKEFFKTTHKIFVTKDVVQDDVEVVCGGNQKSRVV